MALEVREERKIDYNTFVQQMNEAGNKTTRLGNGEANFSDYGNALSDDMKAMITDSFDCEQDYELQSEIAALYRQYGASVMQRGDFMRMLEKNGYKVSSTYIKTSYISDNKADGRYDTDVINGNIGVYTISDGNGGEIVIADANGNGALEIEEVFMNQILGEIAVDVDKIKAADVEAAALTMGADNSVVEKTIEELGIEEASQADFNAQVESYLKKGLSLTTAEMNSENNLDTDNMQYTGSMEELISEEDKEKERKINQDDFNEAIEVLVEDEGKSIKEAVKILNKDLGLDLKYTGSIEE